MNKAMLIGRLGGDPQLKYTPAGKAVVNMTLATDMKWKGSDGESHKKTEWHAIVAWGKLAEICGEWLKKGSHVFFGGRIETRTWEKDGVKHYKTEIIANEMEMLGGGSGKKQEQEEQSAQGESEADGAGNGIPF